mmetsp:Transcript_9918/g.33124  ORF Transcript_9918/g.33124 Transcript_9918/m.33124 type:complete len:119 (+) Transcript_9918:688-1044(+)
MRTEGKQEGGERQQRLPPSLLLHPTDGRDGCRHEALGSSQRLPDLQAKSQQERCCSPAPPLTVSTSSRMSILLLIRPCTLFFPSLPPQSQDAPSRTPAAAHPSVTDFMSPPTYRKPPE